MTNNSIRKAHRSFIIEQIKSMDSTLADQSFERTPMQDLAYLKSQMEWHAAGMPGTADVPDELKGAGAILLSYEGG